MELYLTYALVFLAVSLPLALWRRESGLSDGLRSDSGWDRLPGIYKLLWKPIYLLETTLGDFFTATFPGLSKKRQEFIEASALPLNPARVFVCQAIVAPVGAVFGCLAFLVEAIPPLYQVLAVAFLAFAGWCLPMIALQNLAEARRTEISKTLPFAIDLMGSAMRAGLEFGAAMRYFAGLGNGGALEEEFSRILQEVSLGKPITEGLTDMAARLRIKSFTAFAGTISYGTEIGASIAATLKIHGAELRRERFSLAERKAARAPSMMIFPLAVFIMPAVFVVIFVPVIMQYVASGAAR